MREIFWGGSNSSCKKVASKKLKEGKEMEFYLDDAGSKKKRYGPYHAKKDKNSGKVVVVKGRKVMKGGLLSISDKQRLRRMFILFNINLSRNLSSNPEYSKINALNLSNLGRQIAYFLPIIDRVKYYYKFAVFNEINGNIYIMIYIVDENKVEIVNFVDFFLNPEYSIHFKIVGNSSYEIVRNDIIYRLKNLEIIESRIIQSATDYIWNLLEYKNSIIMYYPDDSRPLRRKCVYPDLTFGILDKETPERIPQNKNSFPTPESPYQRFLILTNTGMSGMSVNEPIIYVRQSELQLQQQHLQLQQQQLQLQQQQLQQQQPQQLEQYIKKQTQFEEQFQFQQKQLEQLQQQQPPHFDYCIYSFGYNQLKIMSYDNVNNNFTMDNIDKLSIIDQQIFMNLVDIPELFGRFKRIKDISRMQIQPETSVIRQDTSAIRQTISAIRQDTPANIQQTPAIRQTMPEIRQTTPVIRKTTPAIRQRTLQVNIPKLSINKLNTAIKHIFSRVTIKNFKINDELLISEFSPIIQSIENLKQNIEKLTEQQLEQEIENIYVKIGNTFENVLRQSQLRNLKP